MGLEEVGRRARQSPQSLGSMSGKLQWLLSAPPGEAAPRPDGSPKPFQWSGVVPAKDNVRTRQTWKFPVALKLEGSLGGGAHLNRRDAKTYSCCREEPRKGKAERGETMKTLPQQPHFPGSDIS